MSSYYAANPHYAADRESDDQQAARENFERAEAEAGKWFARATVVQTTLFQMTMTDLRGLSSPVYDRRREDARAEFKRTTAAAAALCDATVEQLVRTGEISEELCARWDALDAPAAAPVMLQAAE
jgi:nucleotide-binding universal stress UspA family protein